MEGRGRDERVLWDGLVMPCPPRELGTGDEECEQEGEQNHTDDLHHVHLLFISS